MIAAALALLLTAGPARYDADVIGPITIESITATAIQMYAAAGPEVSVRINSPGGDPMAVLLFNDLMRDTKAERHLHVTCVGTMMVASAAAILLESDFCDVRVLEPATMVLFHGAAMGTSGKSDSLEDDVAALRVLDRAIAALIAPRMHMTVDEYLAWIRGRDRWISPDVALELGYVDRVERWAGSAHPKADPGAL